MAADFKESASFLKKEAKNFYLPRVLATAKQTPPNPQDGLSPGETHHPIRQTPSKPLFS
jgi:hypothetical protein